METQQNSDYAGFWLRFIALIIDTIVIQILQSMVVIPLLAIIGLTFLIPTGFDDFINGGNFTEDDMWVLLPAILSTAFSIVFLSKAIQILYFSLMESSKHQATLGKLALGIKVTDLEGNRIDFVRSLFRQLGKILSSMLMFIGYLMTAFTPKKQALHDVLSNCLVVRS